MDKELRNLLRNLLRNRLRNWLKEIHEFHHKGGIFTENLQVGIDDFSVQPACALPHADRLFARGMPACLPRHRQGAVSVEADEVENSIQISVKVQDLTGKT